MRIKEQIEALHADGALCLVEGNPPKRTFDFDIVTVDDLRALAASHTALLEAAKQHVRDQKQLDDLCVDTCDFYNLEDAIEEAEKL